MSGIYLSGIEMPTCGATMILIFPNGDVREMKYGSDQWELSGQAIVLPSYELTQRPVEEANNE